MSGIELIIEERTADIGKFSVGRLLPFRQKRMVGPFIYIDHMGPLKLDRDNNFDVLPHPHIGLSTLTYLFEGSIMHRDSLGNAIEIKPGEVNWMTAGKGIVHSERTPEHQRHTEKHLHGLQIWVALPADLEQMNPEFFHITENEIPAWEQDGVNFKLIAGEAFNRKSGVPVYSKLYFIEIKSVTNQKVDVGRYLYGESGLYILEGNIECDGTVYEPKKMLVVNDGSLRVFTMQANSTVYIVGGEPFPEERFIDWNFVSSRKDLIAEARQNWTEQKFDKVNGDEIEFIPYPPAFKK